MLLALVAAAIWGTAKGVGRLSSMADEPCTVTNAERQIRIDFGDAETAGDKTLMRDIITSFFGLTNGVNLAGVDFREKRAQFMERPDFSRVKNLSVEWRQSDCTVKINVTERVPVARIGKNLSCDEEGVAIKAPLGRNAPSIAPARGRKYKPGERLAGRDAAALRLVLAAKTAAPRLAIHLVVADERDYLLVVFTPPSGMHRAEARIAWDGMDDPPGAAADKAVSKRLELLSKAVESGCGEPEGYWISMDGETASFVPL